MPYLASNQDVKDQKLWSSVLIGSGIVLGAAAIGGAMSASKLTKSMKAPSTKSDVVKGLYGKSGKGVELGAEGWKNIKARNFKMDGEKFAPGVKRYNAGKSFMGKPKLQRTDGNFIQNAWTNFTDKDLKMFNKDMKSKYKGTNLGVGDAYGKSKLSLYEDLEKKSKGFNTNTNELTKLTNQIYDSEPSQAIRKASKMGGIADDVKVTNDIWGEMYEGKRYNSENYKDAINSKRGPKVASASRTQRPVKSRPPTRRRTTDEINKLNDGKTQEFINNIYNKGGRPSMIGPHIGSGRNVQGDHKLSIGNVFGTPSERKPNLTRGSAVSRASRTMRGE